MCRLLCGGAGVDRLQWGRAQAWAYRRRAQGAAVRLDKKFFSRTIWGPVWFESNCLREGMMGGGGPTTGHC